MKFSGVARVGGVLCLPWAAESKGQQNGWQNEKNLAYCPQNILNY